MTWKSSTRTSSRLAERVGEERVAVAEQDERERYALEELALGDVRRARSMTQIQLAKALGVSQAQVSRIESQTDLFLSTLASYVEAMGGELDLIATFPDKRVVLSIGDLVESSASEPIASGPSTLVDAIASELGLPPAAVESARVRGTMKLAAETGHRTTRSTAKGRTGKSES